MTQNLVSVGPARALRCFGILSFNRLSTRTPLMISTIYTLSVHSRKNLHFPSFSLGGRAITACSFPPAEMQLNRKRTKVADIIFPGRAYHRTSPPPQMHFLAAAEKAKTASSCNSVHSHTFTASARPMTVANSIYSIFLWCSPKTSTLY